MNQTLENIILINKQKTYISNILKQIIQNQVVFEVYNLSSNTKGLELYNNTKLSTYGNQIQSMMRKCFIPNATYSIIYDRGLWFIAKLKDKLVSALLVLYDSKTGDPWIWNVCREPQYREYGFGEILIKYALNHLKIYYPDKKRIYLYASQKPVSRTKYYQSIGFVKLNEYDEYGNPVMVFTQHL